jgi:hypothetical protein
MGAAEIILLGYIALVVTVGVALGFLRLRRLGKHLDLLDKQVDLLGSLKKGQSAIGESLAEVETIATVHSASSPGAADRTGRIQAMRASRHEE